MNNKENQFMLVLSLLVINKGEPLNNSYRLIRLLEWSFHAPDIDLILAQIKDENLVEYSIVNKIHHYNLTIKGKELIKKEYNSALTFLLTEYPKETEIITNLFDSFHV